jgi:two-component system, cell cycle sensor histidine kinase and response regulator CckA
VLNARDAMPDGGAILIRTATAIENGVTWARLSVADTGTGMTAAVQAQMFEPFFTTKPAGKGTGLGLHHVRTHVMLLGGRIRCSSEVGRGTTFEIDLPTTVSVTDDMTPLPPPLVAPTPLSGDYSTVVLVVDDEDGVRLLAHRILEMRGMTVLAAGDAGEAERVADAHPGRIDLLLTDLLLPSSGGRELAERLRARRPGLRVVYMSGLSAEGAAEQGLVDASAAFVQKPFKPASLHAAVMRAMGVVA